MAEIRLLKAEGQPGLNKGYAFVAFADRAAASKAVGALPKAEYKDFKEAKARVASRFIFIHIISSLSRSFLNCWIAAPCGGAMRVVWG